MSENNAEDAKSEGNQSENTENSESENSENSAGEYSLGDAGKQALERMKAERKSAKDDAAAARRELAEIKATLALKDKPAEEQAIEAARTEARAEANKAANARIVKTELRLAAKGVLADPADAIAFINLDDFTVGDDGEVDSDALTEAINELLERKPHLAAGKPNRFDGGADQGAKGKAAKLGQLTEADLESMNSAEIDKARRDGRLNKVLGIT